MRKKNRMDQTENECKTITRAAGSDGKPETVATKIVGKTKTAGAAEIACKTKNAAASGERSLTKNGGATESVGKTKTAAASGELSLTKNGGATESVGKTKNAATSGNGSLTKKAALNPVAALALCALLWSFGV